MAATGHKRVLVIGAGISGLTSVKSCLEEGLDVLCLEQFDYIGGGWHYTESYKNGQGAAVWRSLHGNGGSFTAGFSDLPFPHESNILFSHEVFLRYLQDYAEHFTLLPHIRLGTRVTKVDKAPDYDVTGRWKVAHKKGENPEESDLFDYVIVASGYHRVPTYPDIPGMELFKGEQSHSLNYRNPEHFKGKKVAIIGNCFSAGDIATDLAGVAEQVYLCLGRGTFMMPVITPSGVPVEHLLFVRLMKYVPLMLLIPYMKSVLRRFVPNKINMANYGVPAHSDMPIFPFIMADTIHSLIAKGKVVVKGGVAKMAADSFLLQSGESITGVDAVIFGTGYRPSFPFIDTSVIAADREEMKIYKQVWPIDLKHHTLATVGCCGYVPGAVATAFELQARWAAAVFSGNCRLPDRDAMLSDVNQIRTFEKAMSTRVRWMMPFNLYTDDIAAEIGARPKLVRSLLWDRDLGNRLLCGPTFPVQFRIWGRHALRGAREEYLRLCVDHYDRAITVPDVSTMARLGLLATALLTMGSVVWVWKWKDLPIPFTKSGA